MLSMLATQQLAPNRWFVNDLSSRFKQPASRRAEAAAEATNEATAQQATEQRERHTSDPFLLADAAAAAGEKGAASRAISTAGGECLGI